MAKRGQLFFRRYKKPTGPSECTARLRKIENWSSTNNLSFKGGPLNNKDVEKLQDDKRTDDAKGVVVER